MDILQIVEEKFKGIEAGFQKEISFKGDIGNLPFSAYLYIKPNTNKLFVMFNGALDERHSAKTPIYQRWSWHEEFASVLYITDPTLLEYSEIKLAWYIGDKSNRVDIKIAEFVSKVATNLKVDKIIPYGSSGGGFASIQLASNIGRNCIAVAINPQTNVVDYVKKFVDQYINVCWKAVSKDVLKDDLSFNAIHNYMLNKPKILYIQNITDEFHYKKHLLPFLEAINFDKDLIEKPLDKQSGFVKVLIYNHESGHAAEPKELLPVIFKAIEDF